MTTRPTGRPSTVARPITVPVASRFSRHFYALWLPVPGLALLGLGMGRDRRRRRIAGILLLCLVFPVLARLVGWVLSAVFWLIVVVGLLGLFGVLVH